MLAETVGALVRMASRICPVDAANSAEPRRTLAKLSAMVPL